MTSVENATIKIPTTGVFDFPNLILGGEGKYVDKTDLLYMLASPKSDAQLFMSRPRRFGKSLMLSTLKAMFEGRRAVQGPRHRFAPVGGMGNA